jgi:hypothetical protein
MRLYKEKITPSNEFAFSVSLDKNETTEEVRLRMKIYSDDDCYWAKKTEKGLFQSYDELFNTEKEDATHLIIYLK